MTKNVLVVPEVLMHHMSFQIGAGTCLRDWLSVLAAERFAFNRDYLVYFALFLCTKSLFFYVGQLAALYIEYTIVSWSGLYFVQILVRMVSQFWILFYLRSQLV